LDIITLPFHTSHAFKPLDVSCFKPFKINFKKERDNAMVKNNHCKLISADYANETLDQSLFRKNIKNGFGGARIWPFNTQAMDDNIKPSGV
jgi:hypothetical protein